MEDGNISYNSQEVDQARDMAARASDGRDAQNCFGRRLKVSIKGSKDITPQAKASVVLMCG